MIIDIKENKQFSAATLGLHMQNEIQIQLPSKSQKSRQPLMLIISNQRADCGMFSVHIHGCYQTRQHYMDCG